MTLPARTPVPPRRLASARELGVGRPFVERGPLGAAVVGVDEPHVVEAHEPEDRGVQVVALKASESLATGAVPLLRTVISFAMSSENRCACARPRM